MVSFSPPSPPPLGEKALSLERMDRGTRWTQITVDCHRHPWPGMASQTPRPQPTDSQSSRGWGGEGARDEFCERPDLAVLGEAQVQLNLQMQNYGDEEDRYLMRQSLGGIGFWLTCKKKAEWGRPGNAGAPWGRQVWKARSGRGWHDRKCLPQPRALVGVPEGRLLPESWPWVGD